jgi:hypothetical protein
LEAGKRTINEIFNGSRLLEIPFFQRTYVWDESQWERLLEDVEMVSSTNRPYFMGAVILKQQQTSTSSRPGDVRAIIDGQQRLTTLSILFKVLCLKTNSLDRFVRRFLVDDGRTVIQHNRYDTEAYTKIMNLQSPEEISGDDKISRCYMYFLNNLDPSKLDFDVISHSLLFVVIDLASDEDEQQIFDTINSLGVTLTTAELLKNYFFRRDQVEQYEKYWFEVFEKDEETREYWEAEIAAGRSMRTFIDLFFFAFLQIKIQEKELDVSTEDKLGFSKVERLFESYKRFVKEYCGDDKQSILEEIREYALLFRNTFDSEVVYRELPAEAGVQRLNAVIFAMDTTTIIPYLLFVERNQPSESARTELYGYLESYLLRRLITRQTTKNYNQLFADRLIHNRVLTREEFIAYLAGQDEKINRMPEDDEVREAFSKTVLTNKYATGVLYLIESKIRDRSRHATQLLGVRQYSLEHIMPKKWRNHWGQLDPEAASIRDRKLLTLGNLTIITQSLNASIRDADWQTKLQGKGNRGGLKKYTEGIETISSYLDLPAWDEGAIEKRGEHLADLALNIWPVIRNRQTSRTF